MTPKEKAEQLISNFSPYVYCYMGSGMLTNTCDDEAIKMNAKQCALIAVDEMIAMLPFTDLTTYMGKWCEQQRNYLNEVKQELEKL
jgi:hypothetical protein